MEVLLMPPDPYPVTYDVAYPDRELNRLTTFFRIFTVIPIAIVLGTVSGATWSSTYEGTTTYGAAAGGILFGGPLLMILFREKFPLWWQEWNRQLLGFSLRVGVYMALQDDRYPSTDEAQSVALHVPEVDAKEELNRFLPLVKWFLAIPHYIVLAFLWIAVFFVLIFAWFAILFTGRYPRGAFDFVVGVERWHVRVISYALLLVTDRYPPFALKP
ncbi:DUF4389 domain-containing protein [Svornostia abyssi]|uniref:DUF4389 domain-containing protein n=1 Tax=Svornostia abyssi TaxID=2898438 RepID=A0ABY5PGJ9_9ACTN|nr:DUF4389 domain-containing protein [Parviterribacteraceae bacterium J379]